MGRHDIFNAMAPSLKSNICLILWIFSTLATCRAFIENRHPLFHLYRPAAISVWPKSLSVSDENYSTEIKKSSESNFWRVIPDKTVSISSIPTFSEIDQQVSPLPSGAYRRILNEDDRDDLSTCLIGLRVRPPPERNDGRDVWTQGIVYCHNFIDSGFNTFCVDDNFLEKHTSVNKKQGKANESRNPSLFISNKSLQITRALKRHDAEAKFYHKLRQSTPASVLRTCHFILKLEIPLFLSSEEGLSFRNNRVGPSFQFGNGHSVRQSISDALLRVQSDCLDSVMLEHLNNSPYHLDVLNVLNELKYEGLIRSISTRDFPEPLLCEASECGFNIFSNEKVGSLLNCNNLQLDNEQRTIYQQISAPLAGGLLANQSLVPRNGWQCQKIEKTDFEVLLNRCNEKSGEINTSTWDHYHEIMHVLTELSNKYHVSTASIALRWLLQLPQESVISVGTNLGMDLAEEQGGERYRRHSDLQQVFRFSLELDDFDLLCKVSGLRLNNDFKSEMLN